MTTRKRCRHPASAESRRSSPALATSVREQSPSPSSGGHGPDQPGPEWIEQIPGSMFEGMELQLRDYMPSEEEPGFLKEALVGLLENEESCPQPREQPTLPRLLTAEEVCEILGGISKMTLHRLMKSGELPCVKVSKRRIAFQQDDVEQFICRRTSKALAQGEGRAE